MNTFAALSTLVLLVQLINASPVIENSGKSLYMNVFDIQIDLNYSCYQNILKIEIFTFLLAEVERAIDSLKFASMSGPERQDRERRAASADISGFCLF